VKLIVYGGTDEFPCPALGVTTILSFVISGIISLIKGTRGDWDNKVKPEDMTGPSK
jgi:hypothetical protein